MRCDYMRLCAFSTYGGIRNGTAIMPAIDHAATLNAIQLAIAPVFLLTAIAALIGAAATRLGRIIDRAREVEERLAARTIVDEDAAYRELDRARLRGRIVNFSIGLLTVSG